MWKQGANGEEGKMTDIFGQFSENVSSNYIMESTARRSGATGLHAPFRCICIANDS